MKVAIILRKLNVKGGVQRHALYLARELKKLGHKVKLYALYYSREDCYQHLLEGLEVVANPDAKKLASLIDKETEILNPHDAAYKVAYYFKKSVRNVPSVWTMHDLPLRAWSRWQRENLDQEYRPSIFRKIIFRLKDNYEIARFIRPQNAVVVLDSRDKEWVKKYFKKEAVIIRNGLDSDYFFYKPRTAFAGGVPKLLMAGIFLPHRRFEDGIEAVRILGEKGCRVDLRIIGDYNNDKKYYDRILVLIKELGLMEQIRVLGRISEEELVNEYQRNDIFLFPNHLQSWGLAVFEAMACGLPVVVSRSAGASEVLADKESALLVNPKRPAEIADAVKELIDNQNLCQNLSQNGRRFVEKNISWRIVAGKMSEVFQGILE